MGSYDEKAYDPPRRAQRYQFTEIGRFDNGVGRTHIVISQRSDGAIVIGQNVPYRFLAEGEMVERRIFLRNAIVLPSITAVERMLTLMQEALDTARDREWSGVGSVREEHE